MLSDDGEDFHFPGGVDWYSGVILAAVDLFEDAVFQDLVGGVLVALVDVELRLSLLSVCVLLALVLLQ